MNTVLPALYASVLRLRLVLERLEQEYAGGEMHVPLHLGTGQEAVAAGVCLALTADDYVMATYRGHAQYLAKGGNLRALVAELFGRATGCARGYGGSMHLNDPAHGLLGSSGIVGGGIPLAAGAALAAQRRADGRVAVVFFGDGAVDEGVLYETVNFAVLHRLPLLFVCENNLYAVCSPVTSRHGPPGIAGRFAGWGLPVQQLDGNDAVAVHAAAAAWAVGARAGGGPAFLECRTYRWRGHAGPGEEIPGYRSDEEVAAWQARCPLRRLEEQLRAAGQHDAAEEQRLRAAVAAEFDAALAQARRDPLPDPLTLGDCVYAHE